MSRVALLGCILCGNKANNSVHHVVEGSRRKGHYFTIPLCWEHHQSGYDNAMFTSRHPHKARFEYRYGTEQYLLCKTYRLLKREHGIECPDDVRDWIGPEIFSGNTSRELPF